MVGHRGQSNISNDFFIRLVSPRTINCFNNFLFAIRCIEDEKFMRTNQCVVMNENDEPGDDFLPYVTRSLACIKF